jgi:hypothetical protein
MASSSCRRRRRRNSLALRRGLWQTSISTIKLSTHWVLAHTYIICWGTLGAILQWSVGNTHKEFALEILMTMAPILDEGVPSLSFHLEGIQQVVPYENIRELLGFQKSAPEKVDVPEGMLDGFWNLISGEAHQQRNSIRNPIIQVFHSWMCNRIMERMRETKVTNTELNWLYSALIVRQPIDPSYPMINRWCCEATSGSGYIGSGCYLSMLAISLRPGISRNPEHLLPGTSLGFEYLK